MSRFALVRTATARFITTIAAAALGIDALAPVPAAARRGRNAVTGEVAFAAYQRLAP